MKTFLSAFLGLIFLPVFCFAETTTPAPIDCQYQLAKDTDAVEQKLLSTWAENAAIQSFQFNAENLKTELNALKNCYTAQGWKGFNEALKTSGNLEAIKNNQLTVTSKISGVTQIQNIKEKQWKVSVPLKVTYQNKDKELLQTLDVSLLIALNKSGTLGIMQVIAVPEQSENTKT
jgi:hypothetical protein